MFEVVYEGFLKGLGIGVCEKLELKEGDFILSLHLNIEALLLTKYYSFWSYPCDVLSVGHQVKNCHLGGSLVFVEL